MTHLWLTYGAALALSGTAAYTDARTGHIPNWLTLPPLAVAPFVHALRGGLSEFAFALLAILLCGLVPYVMFRKNAAGGGDVKLLAALGAVGGIGFGIEAQLFGFGFAAFYALARLTWSGRLLRTFANTLFLAVNPLLPKKLKRPVAPEVMTSVRLGVPIFAGTLLAVWVRTAVFGI